MKDTHYELQGWLVVFFGVFGVLLWAGLYPLDQGVSASGFLIPQSEKITIVSPSTGMITRMHHKNAGHDSICRATHGCAFAAGAVRPL